MKRLTEEIKKVSQQSKENKSKAIVISKTICTVLLLCVNSPSLLLQTILIILKLLLK